MEASPLPAPLVRLVPCPAGMRRATHGRLIGKHNRRLRHLQQVPCRPFSDVVRKRIATRLRNQLRRVRRRLRLPEPEPRRRRWYPISAAADFPGISSRTLLRWSAAGASRRGRLMVAIRASMPGISPIFGKPCGYDKAPACVSATPPVPCASAWGWAASGTSRDADTASPLEAACCGATRRARTSGPDRLGLRDGLELLHHTRAGAWLATEGRRGSYL
jgi:hypothetical protein